MSEDRFSAPVAQLRAKAATQPFEAVIEEARNLLAGAEVQGGPDLPALLILIGDALSSGGDFTEAVRHLTRAHDAAGQIADRALEAESAGGIGKAFLSADDHSSALRHFERAEKLATECGHDRLRANLLRRMGVSFSILGRHQQAMEHLNEAGAVLATLDDTLLDRLQLANSMLNARSREIEEWPANDPSTTSANAALLPQWLELADDARAAGAERIELLALGNSAISARDGGKLSESIRVLRELIPRYAALGMRPNVVISWNHLGYASEATGDWRDARHAFEQALALLEAGGSIRERRDAYDGLARACEQTDDAWGALAAVKAARAIDSEMHDEEARRLAAQRQDRVELARLTERWERLAEQDPLTGLDNRRALETWLEETAGEPGRPFSLLMIDLDHFKAVNDKFGHSTGDSVLVAVGRLLRDGCREHDLAVRYGGEEFVIALSGADAAVAGAIARRIRASIAVHKWGNLVASLKVTASIGCASSTEGGDADAVLARADQRLYAAKRMGRNRVCAT